MPPGDDAVSLFFCFFFWVLPLGEDAISSFFSFFFPLLPLGFELLPRRGDEAIFFEKSMTLR